VSFLYKLKILLNNFLASLKGKGKLRVVVVFVVVVVVVADVAVNSKTGC
jgi:hypothetical protein